ASTRRGGASRHSLLAPQYRSNRRLTRVKRLIVGLLLIAAMVAPAAAADGPSGNLTVTAWPSWANPNNAALKRMVAAFNEVYPDIRVEVLQWSTAEYDDKVMTLIAAGET